MQALSLIVLFALALPAMGTDPLTLTLGSTAYVLTSSQVTVAAASIAALALTKELLILADLGEQIVRSTKAIDTSKLVSKCTFVHTQSTW